MSKWLIGLVCIIGGFYVVKWIIEPSYNIIDKDAIELSDYKNSDELVRDLETLQRESFDYKKIINGGNNHVLLVDVNEEYVIGWTGIQGLDDGLKFFVVPNYSTLYVINRKSKTVDYKFTFIETVTNATVNNGKLYMVFNPLILPNRLAVLDLSEYEKM